MKRATWLTMGLMGIFSMASHAATVTWQGQTWDSSYGSQALNGTDLDVTTGTPSSSYYYGDSHYNTDSAFRSQSTPYVEVTFHDTLDPNGGGYLAIEQESGANATWAEIGVDPSNGSTTNYSLYWWNEVNNQDQTMILAPRTSGNHTFKISRESGGALSFWLDGTQVLSTTSVTPDYLGDVYLFAASSASGSVATFKSYQAGSAVPLPASAVGGLTLLGGFVLRRHRRG